MITLIFIFIVVVPIFRFVINLLVPKEAVVALMVSQLETVKLQKQYKALKAKGVQLDDRAWTEAFWRASKIDDANIRANAPLFERINNYYK